MYNILLIGAGQLGSRHLQGLAKLKEDAQIYVVDPSSESLKIAEMRLNEIAERNTTHTRFENGVMFHGEYDAHEGDIKRETLSHIIYDSELLKKYLLDI